MPLLISVIVAVFNGLPWLKRAVDSVRAQAFDNWELICVDDCSTDGTTDALTQWAAEEPRIRVVRQAENMGHSAGRNAGLRAARGEFVTYLDHDDEYYPDYLAHVARLSARGDVLVFAYDIEQPDLRGRPVVTEWDPAAVRGDLFARNISTPLGVAHRRALIADAGGFEEVQWLADDWDLWKRFARLGVEFLFVPHKSGRYHVRPDSLSRVPRLTARQRAIVKANRQAGKPIYGDRHPAMPRRKVKKIAFMSSHCVVDFTNGAAAASLDCLRLLRKRGFECQAFCGSWLDATQEMLLEEVLARQGLPYECRTLQVGPYACRLIFSNQDEVPVTIFQKATNRAISESREDVEPFLAACNVFLERNRPDAVVTFGGDVGSLSLLHLIKRRDIPVVFGLHNFAFDVDTPFRQVDYVTVPSDCAQEHYWDKLGLHCFTLPPLVSPERTIASQRQPTYLTFVNPNASKGVQVFGRIAEVLTRRRPDIPMLVVEGRGRRDVFAKLGLVIDALNLKVMENQFDPRGFYAATKVLLVPSLVRESFGLVAAEAMANGIPVLGSTRGALAGTIADAGFLFDIPAQYTPESLEMPTEAEVEPWVETIVRLWDDAAYYDRWSAAARQRAQRWLPEQLGPVYHNFFANLFPQPGPPLVPKERPA